MTIADYKYAGISSFALLDVKFWLKEDSYLLFIFFQIHSFENAKYCLPSVIMSYPEKHDKKFLHDHNQHKSEFHISNLENRRSLGI